MRGSAGLAWRSTRRGSQTPFHSLTSSLNVASTGAPSSTGSAPPRAEGDRARARPARFDGEAHVLAFAHRRARRAGTPRRPSARRPGCRARTAPGAASSSASSMPSSSPPTTASTRSTGTSPLPRARASACCSSAARKRRHALALDLEARGGAVPAVAAAGARRTRSARRAGRSRGCCAPEPRAARPVERDQHDRAVVALGQARGDDPDHARVPALAGEHVGARARPARRPALRPRSGSAARPRGARRWRGRAPAAICRARSGSSVSSSSRPASARYRRPAALMRGAEREAERALVDAPGVDARDAHQRAQARPAASPPARAGRARTSARFSPSSGTTSAIVASATRSSSASSSQRVAPGGARARPARACRRPPSRTAPGTGSRTAPGARSARPAAARRRAARDGR